MHRSAQNTDHLEEEVRGNGIEMGRQLFLILTITLALGASQAKLELNTDPSPVVVKAGETVNLKCLLKVEKMPLDMKRLMVQWYNRGKLVAEYDEKLTINKPEVSMSIDALTKGDATLTITKPTHEHSGNYRCYVYYATDQVMKQITLQVDDPNKPKEEDIDLGISDTIIKSKVDKIIDLFSTFDRKLDVLIRDSKKCSPKK
ncbi:uncharacterized protein LOC128642458 [Bombina bombina]|uniref:uncharacterized protein LOC128642458 n=1 Tax=Bombina bombina TaxID=8345 RepID=UPI00235AD1D4|nr:uncharacterized protein LOC128642458 [Bombina bombina]